jgi:hypothetical protein
MAATTGAFSAPARRPAAPLLLGDDETGQLWTLDAAVGDDDGTPIVRVVSGGIPVVGRIDVLDRLTLQCSVGWSPDVSLVPVISCRFSRDGFTWSDPKPRSLGAQGQYSKWVRWDRQGEMRPPGMMIEFTDSDAAQTTLSYARYNEAA